ncbi:YitT family protein [Shimia thalassica]|uniref:YitT family protein n=1 Tax=Shimia thalassica TaxID=1715693 RepID=UPI002732E825|nr:YitT family protein [Shimia thalassica]MDP2520250.1 YitT family protein [Shimia thalassica]
MTFLLETPPADRHSLNEDVQGLIVGTLLVALSVQFLQASHLITGQIAGLSLLGAYWGGWSFGAVFFVLNLPFYGIAMWRMGLRFTLKTFAAVGTLTAWTFILPKAFTIGTIHPAAAAVLAGVTAGAGLLALFRHGATLGGVGIVAVWLQDTKGIKAGWVQLGFDACVFTLALMLFPLPVVGWSLLGAVVTNIVIVTNHRRDRYIAR